MLALVVAFAVADPDFELRGGWGGGGGVGGLFFLPCRHFFLMSFLLFCPQKMVGRW